MKRFTVLPAALLAAATFLAIAPRATAQTSDQAQIRALENRYAKALRRKDLNGIMSVYVPDQSLLVFDVIPPRQYKGAKAYRKDWEEFLALFDGPITFEMSDLQIVAGGHVAFSHSIQHVAGKMKDGSQMDLTLRWSDGYRKIKGKWLIAHEHVSVPVDITTGKADLTSKP